MLKKVSEVEGKGKNSSYNESCFDGRPKTFEGIGGSDKLLEALYKFHPERIPKS
jgi:hypothetical protein